MLKLGMISLGCVKNQVDTEEILGVLGQRGYIITDELAAADIIIVNTCAFIESAQEESIETLLEIAQYKKTGNCKLLIAAGCLPQLFMDDIVSEIPEIDAAIGVGNPEIYPEVINRSLRGEKLLYNKLEERRTNNIPRLLISSPHSVYIKISEGCNNHCSYCLIPSIRGPQYSKKIELILEEANQIVKNGAKEINLIAQDTTAYGIDLYGKPALAKLLTELAKIEELQWIRIMYAHPERITPELIDCISRESNICKYIDIPLQHASTKILKSMGRNYTKKDIFNLIEKLNKIIPGITLRTTFMIGFPGETEKDFQEIVRILEKEFFNRVGIFIYSQEKGTLAAKMSSQIPSQVKKERFERLIAIQQKASAHMNSQLIGKTVEVMVDGYYKEDPSLFFGRTEGHAPEVDGGVIISSARRIKPGDIVTVYINRVDKYDLFGEIK